VNQEVNSFIAKQGKSQQEVLTTLRELIKSLVPQAQEKMSYGVPAFTLNNKSLLYAAFKPIMEFIRGLILSLTSKKN